MIPVIRIEKGSNPNQKKEAVFVAVSTEHAIWQNYEGVAKSNGAVPLLLVMNRWDGKLGFIGGEVEEGETLLQALGREVWEESYLVMNEKKLELVCSHETPHLVTHLFSYRVDFPLFQKILLNQTHAPHFMIEGMLFAAHMANYAEGKNALQNFMQHNLALSVREEMHELLDFLQWNRP